MSSRSYALKAEKREKAGKGVARAVRRERKVPGVIYGDGKTPVTISMPEKEVEIEFNKGHMFTSLCDLEVGSDKHLVLARDVQTHPVSDRVMHIDFLRVTPKTKIRVWIPVKFHNFEESPGGSEKGSLNIVRHEIEMSCIATDIPDHIDVDLSKVEIGDTVRISAAVMPQGAKPVIERDFVLATVAEPRRIEIEETPAEGAEGAEGAAAEGAEGAAEGGEEKAEGDDKE